MFVWTAYGTKTEVIVPEPLSSPELGALLPSESPRDELVIVETAPAEDGTGTASVSYTHLTLPTIYSV